MGDWRWGLGGQRAEVRASEDRGQASEIRASQDGGQNIRSQRTADGDGWVNGLFSCDSCVSWFLPPPFQVTEDGDGWVNGFFSCDSRFETAQRGASAEYAKYATRQEQSMKWSGDACLPAGSVRRR